MAAMAPTEHRVPDALLEDPDKRPEAAAFVRTLLWEDHDATPATLHELVDRTEPFQTALAVQLVRLEGPDRVRRLVADRADAPAVDVSATVTALLAGREVDGEAADRLTAMSPAARELSASLWDHTRYVPLEEWSEDAAARLFASPGLAPTPSVLTDGLRFTTDAARTQRLEAERLTGYQSHALRTGRLGLNDPTTGEPARLLGHTRHFDTYIYRLRGAVDFLVLAGGPSGRIRGVYLPEEDLFATIDPRDSMQPYDLSKWPPLRIAVAAALLRRRRPLPPRDRPARVTVRLGGPENFAHVLWNTLGGLERERLLGNLERVRTVLSIGSGYFGSPASLFPEIASAEITERAGAGAEVRHVSDPRALEVPVATSLLMPGALARVRTAAAARGIAGPLERALAPYPRRVYVALRVGDKSWANAATELPRLIDHATAADPKLCFLLDGFSVPSGDDHVSHRWAAQREELEALVAEVTGRAAHPDRVVSLLGMDMLSSLAVAGTASAYVCPVGTAHHKIDWLFDMPGVIYSSAEYADRPFDTWAGMQQRVNRHEPVPVVGRDEEADTARRRDAGDRRRHLRNLELGWEEIWAALEPILAAAPSRQGPLRGLLQRVRRTR